MISDQYKCIFIHIPKTAGTSIEQKLGHFKEVRRGVQDHRTISEIEPITVADMKQAILSRDSLRCLRYVKKMIKDTRSNFNHKYHTFFKFSFVRNPWARVFSWYKNVMRDDHHKRLYGINDDGTFKEYLNSKLEARPLNSQLFWLLDKKGNMSLDYIGRFENLTNDFGYVANRIGLKNSELPKLITGDGQCYTQHYDAEMIDIINHRYKEEIDYFGFEYGE